MEGFRTRVLITGLLALVALGGAGLAVAADRPQNPVQRPEYSWAADRKAQPWLTGLRARLTPVSEIATDLATAGRATLGNLQALDLDALRGALARGERAALAAQQAIADLADARAQSAVVERWRLSPDVAAAFAAIDAATDGAQTMPSLWQRIADRATLVSGLVDDLQRHDASVFRATTAGRQGHWQNALAVLDDADASLAAATRTRNTLRAVSGVETLDDVLARYSAYDQALRALYAHLAGGGSQSGSRFESLQSDVERTQNALPADAGVLSFIVAEAAGTEITEALVSLESVRGDIATALDSGTDGAP